MNEKLNELSGIEKNKDLMELTEQAITGNFEPLRQWAVNTASGLESSSNPAVAAKAEDAYNAACIANSLSSVVFAALGVATALRIPIADKKIIFGALLEKIRVENQPSLELVDWSEKIIQRLEKYRKNLPHDYDGAREDVDWYLKIITGIQKGVPDCESTFLITLEREVSFDRMVAKFLKDLMEKELPKPQK